MKKWRKRIAKQAKRLRVPDITKPLRPGELHAWFSPAKNEMTGHAIYSRANGQHVLVTEVSSKAKPSTWRWGDLVYLGRVTKFIRTPPHHGDLMFGNRWF